MSMTGPFDRDDPFDSDNIDGLFLAIYRLWRCTVNSFKCKVVLIGLLLTLAITVSVLAQTIKDVDDGTTLEQIIIFGRHSIRSSVTDTNTLAQFSTNSYPVFVGVPTEQSTPDCPAAQPCHMTCWAGATTTGTPPTTFAWKTGVGIGVPRTHRSAHTLPALPGFP